MTPIRGLRFRNRWSRPLTTFIDLPPKVKNLTGERYERLIVLGPIERRGNGHTVYSCRCDCGAPTNATCSNLRSRHTQSCGCLMRERTSLANGTHRRSKTRLYGVWVQMRQRCELATAPNYRWYGGRGIRVCQRWKDSFEAFVQDMGDRPNDCEIDRIDNDGHYEPGNCRWVTKQVNLQNRSPRGSRSVNHGALA